jgi:hypothetical protein
MSWQATLASWLTDHTLLARLGFATLELLAASLLLAAFLRWKRGVSPRLASFLWLAVLAKPIVSLALGAPIGIAVLERLRLRGRSLVRSAPALDTASLARDQVLTRNARGTSGAGGSPPGNSREQPRARGRDGSLCPRSASRARSTWERGSPVCSRSRCAISACARA